MNLISFPDLTEASGIEKVLQWVAFHGIWMGTESVRTQLTKYLTNQIGVHNPPSSDLAVLVKDLLSKLLGELSCFVHNSNCFSETECRGVSYYEC